MVQPSRFEKFTEDHICCIVLLLIILLASIFVSLVCLALYLPSILLSPPNFEFKSLSVSLTNINEISGMSSPLLTANWSMNVHVESLHSFTPVDFLYENVESRILYHNISLANTWLSPFYVTSFSNDYYVVFAVNSTASSLPINRSLADDMVSDWRNGLVEFTIVIKATARVDGLFGERSKKAVDVVSRKHVKVAFLRNDTYGINIQL